MKSKRSKKQKNNETADLTYSLFEMKCFLGILPLDFKYRVLEFPLESNHMIKYPPGGKKYAC